MTNILRLPANTQAYLTVERDVAEDKFDILDLTYDYINEVVEAFPAAWAYWKMEEESGDRLDSTPNARDLSPAGSTLPDLDGGMVHFVYDGGTGTCRLERAESWDPSSDKKFMFAFWLKSTEIPGLSFIDSFHIQSNIYITVQASSIYWGTQAISIVVETGDPWALGIYINPNTHPLTPNVDHFIVVYYDQTGLYLEVDNVAWGNSPGSHNMSTNSNLTKVGYPNYTDLESWCKEFGIWVGDDTNTQSAIDRRAELWNNGNGWSPY